MTNRNKKRLSHAALPLILIATLAATGCASLNPPKPPPGEVQVPPGVETPAPVETQGVALFFPDWQVQHVIPELRQVPEATGAELATEVVRELLAGPTDPQLRAPFPNGVRLLEPVKVQGGIAQVNLSKELRAVQGSAGTTAALNALRLSLTEIEGIQQVQVLIEGEAGGELNGLVLEPMDRGLYLYPVIANPERAKALQERYAQGLDPWRADPVQVAQWEGRMFGFTAAELQGAQVTKQGTTATAQVTRDGATYSFTLVQNQVAGGTGVWTIDAINPLVRHSLAGLPAKVRAWADLYTGTTVGASHQEGGRTYLLASVEEGAVQIESVKVQNGQAIVTIVEGGTAGAAIVSIPESVSGARFQWKSAPTGPAGKQTDPTTLPVVANPHQLPEVKLTGNAVVVAPTANQTVSGAIVIKGYARHLFEASISARLLDASGKEVGKVSTTAAASAFDWGSFSMVLEHDAPAGNYRLELGTYSAMDGSWQARIAVPVKVSR